MIRQKFDFLLPMKYTQCDVPCVTGFRYRAAYDSKIQEGQLA